MLFLDARTTRKIETEGVSFLGTLDKNFLDPSPYQKAPWTVGVWQQTPIPAAWSLSDPRELAFNDCWAGMWVLYDALVFSPRLLNQIMEQARNPVPCFTKIEQGGEIVVLPSLGVLVVTKDEGGAVSAEGSRFGAMPWGFAYFIIPILVWVGWSEMVIT